MKTCPHCERPHDRKGTYCSERCQRRAAEQRSRRKHRLKTRRYHAEWYRRNKLAQGEKSNAYYRRHRLKILARLRRKYRVNRRQPGEATPAQIRAAAIALHRAAGRGAIADRLERP